MLTIWDGLSRPTPDDVRSSRYDRDVAEPLRHKLALFLQHAERFDDDEVPDPYYGGPAGFERVLDLIEDAADGLVRELLQRSGQTPPK